MKCSRRLIFKRPVKQVLVTCILLFLLVTFINSVIDQPRSFRVEVNNTSIPHPHVYPIEAEDSIQMVEVEDKSVQEDSAIEPSVPVDTHGCPDWFNVTMKQNLDVISAYPRGEAHKYMFKMDKNRTTPAQMLTSFPVIATAANSGFYGVTLGLLQTIYEVLLPKYPDIKVVYYDMGLLPPQRETLLNKCSICEVRKFPFHEYPGHVGKLKTYTWKPIIVRTLLMEFGWVWWMDSSVRFKTNDVDRALEYSQKHSLLFFTYDIIFAVAQHTDQQTMKYFNENPCKFRHFGEVEATFVLFHFDDVTKTVVDAWAACALNQKCMCPKGTEHKLSCNVKNKADGRCHRFDQAVLSVLLRRLFHKQNDYPEVDTPFKIHEIRRGHSVDYKFNNVPPKVARYNKS